MISLKEAKILIMFARDSILSLFNNKKISVAEVQTFSNKQGVFVTLKKFHKLRGCIGFPRPVYPLNQAILRAARAAAYEDPRFPRVTEEEFEDITIEISILSLPELIEVEDPIQYLNQITIGKDGLIIEKRFNSGLLLPQVFVEYQSTPKEALEMTCQKAGLHSESWKEEGCKIYKFQSQVFAEKEPYGDIEEIL